MKRIGILGPVLFLAAVGLPALQPPAAGNGNPPHEWKDQNRIARRLDLVENQRRTERAIAEGRLQRAPASGAVYIDGAANPEILMPFEVFQRLLMAGFLGSDDARHTARASLEPGRVAAGLPPDFWPQLESAAGPLIRSLVGQQRVAEEIRSGKSTLRSSDLKAMQANDCRDRAHGLSAARRAFGTSRFDRFLYESVAPQMGLVSDFDANDGERLLWIEEGCP